MVTEPTHYDGGVLHLVLAGVPNLAGDWVGLPVGTTGHSAIL